ncbi:carboxypeptidase-like regulatory domain-containing protein [Luteolibacter sp. GHJ8]|uniref:Carboxypeptidase-like regulatory domain-containing protein n=1 Tax=Luteolibacter rhizosphaerae TaxID=2989719 RepID=A0ABT3FYV5_9BACT|nr:carboxypeptidase-like regulatory domain-containing protein [Luteolibacter rhizosphaerae]MCW1912772.1 carboxypeptidase-like regulatory domain-containing protein [Luteolibacter rhizosphaerae]
MKKILLSLVIVAALLGAAALKSAESRRITVTLPDGKPAAGATVAISIVSGPALEIGTTGPDGTFDIPWKRFRRARNGSWHSIMAWHQDSAGNGYIGQNHQRPLSFPMGIQLYRR